MTLETLLEYLIPSIAALLTALILFAIAYLRKQIAKINNETVRGALDAALAEAQTVARDAILSTKQAVVDDLKKAREDGKLTREEARSAMNNAINYFMNSISKDSKKILEAAIGPLDDWLEDFLEAKLGETKLFSLSPFSSDGE